MDVLITSTGRIFRRMDDCTALALIEALPSVFERVTRTNSVPPPALQNTNPPAKTEWFIAHPPSGDNTVWCILCKHVGGAVMYFTGDPEKFKKKPPIYCDSTCPPEVVAEYARLKAIPLPRVGLSDEERNAAAVNQLREKNATRW